MKLKNIVLILLLGSLFFMGCSDEAPSPKVNLDDAVAPVLSSSNALDSVMLLKANADSIFSSFSWTEADYGLDLDVYYRLEFDYDSNNFNDPKILASSKDLSFDLNVLTLNNKLLSDSIPAGEYVELSFRVVAFVNTDKVEAPSNAIKYAVAPYSDLVLVAPIYLLGGGTSAGWNNDDRAIPAVYLPESGADSTFAVVDSLTPAGTNGSDGFLKFVRYVGLWAPQWGTDATGTSESGPLVLRPTEDVADPAAIPVPDVIDDYLIKVDIVNLTYTITETVQTLHIIGDATEAVWDNTKAIPMEKLAPGKFQLVANLSADASEGFKFLELQGAWAPMYGQDGNGTWEKGKLQYRPTESVADPKSIPPPPNTGSYLIEVDIAAGTYKVTAQ